MIPGDVTSILKSSSIILFIVIVFLAIREVLAQSSSVIPFSDSIVILIFLVVSTVLMIFIDAGTIQFTVEQKWTDLLQLVLITVIGAYFGGRSFEKRKK